MFDLHRHDMFSLFDGFGTAADLAQQAKALGYTALGLTNHGNTCGLYKHYCACKDNGLKPVLGVEGYFLPVYAEKQRGYHLILIAKNLRGYQNLNILQTEGEKRRYFNPIWDFDLIAKYSEGLICTSACVSGYLSQALLAGARDKAARFCRKMQGIFGADFYAEIQPYKIDEKGTQERVNYEIIKLAGELHLQLILTSDSHRGEQDDLPTYLKMHEISGHDLEWARAAYSERYMPGPREMQARFVKMHRENFTLSQLQQIVKKCEQNLLDIEEKVEDAFLDKLELKMPIVESETKISAEEQLKAELIAGMKRRGCYTDKRYKDRVKEEYHIIKLHKFADYFLIVQDYVNYAKKQGVFVGPGRGSVCNCLAAYVLGITEVDSLALGLDFRRFLREDKTTIPDVDLDFETERRGEIIDYLTKRYPGKAARICSYGLYKLDNCINDLATVCKLPTAGEIDEAEKRCNAQILSEIKHFVRGFLTDDGDLLIAELRRDPRYKDYNRRYDNIILHFAKLYRKVKFIGTHAAGVAITGNNLLQYTALRTDKAGDWFTCFDLQDCESLNLIKFDILGLQTMGALRDMARLTGILPNYAGIVCDKTILQKFAEGKTDGVFQFDKDAPRRILQSIDVTAFDDVAAATAMNRPGPLKMHTPEQYIANKHNENSARDLRPQEKAILEQCAGETYGTIIYQEQIMQLCVALGLTWGEADKIIKMAKNEAHKRAGLEELKKSGLDLERKFLLGCKAKGFSKKFSVELFESVLDCYSFNKGHAVGYTLISFAEMFYKTRFPAAYWLTRQKYAKDEGQFKTFAQLAYLCDGVVNFLPHVNYSGPRARLRLQDGEKVIQQGLQDIHGIGGKAAEAIAAERNKNGFFCDYDNFLDRMAGNRAITSKTVEILRECGALEFDYQSYIQRVTKYTSSFYAGRQARLLQK